MDMSWSAAHAHKRAMNGYVGGMPASWSAVDVHNPAMDSIGRPQELEATEATKAVHDRLHKALRALDEKEDQMKTLLGALQELLALVQGQPGRLSQPAEWRDQQWQRDVVLRAEQAIRQVALGSGGIGNGSGGVDPRCAPSDVSPARPAGQPDARLDPRRAPIEVSPARPADQPDSAVLEPSAEPGQPCTPRMANGETADILAKCQAMRQQWGSIKSDTVFSALQRLSGVTPDASAYAPGVNGGGGPEMRTLSSTLSLLQDTEMPDVETFKQSVRTMPDLETFKQQLSAHPSRSTSPIGNFHASGRTDGGAGVAEPANLQGAADPPRPWAHAGAYGGEAGQICFGGYSASRGCGGVPAPQGGHLRGAGQLQARTLATDRASWPSPAAEPVTVAAGTSPWAWARPTSPWAGRLGGPLLSAAPRESPQNSERLSF